MLNLPTLLNLLILLCFVVAKKRIFKYHIPMFIQKCKDAKSWDDYFILRKQAEFLQSWQWGEFQAKVGNKPIRLQMVENGQILKQVQGFEQKIAPFVKFIYLPKMGNCPEVLDYLAKLGYFFARIEPVEDIKIPMKYPVFNVANRQSQNTFLLNVTLNEEELLAGMHAKTRYNIKLAEKNRVVVKEEKNIDVFWKLNQVTVARDKFKSHNREYYKKMLEMANCYQLTAYFENVAVASNILIHFGDMVTYLHGASSDEHRNLMASYLLQWQGILLSKKLGAFDYDFGGVSPELVQFSPEPSRRAEVKEGENKTITCYHNYCWEATHKWTGITRFKAGFGGRGKKYPQAVEVVFKSFLYKLFQLVKKVL